MIEIIPAIDLIDGKCVRLSQGDYERKKIYNENPVEVAKIFEDSGIKRLHLVDLDGAKRGKITNISVLEKIAYATKLQIDFGGGVKTTNDFLSVLNAGAKFVAVGSVAVKNTELFTEWISHFGANKIFLGTDVNDKKLAVSAWQEKTEIDIFDFLKEKTEQGINYVFCTDIAKDGMLQGASNELYSELTTHFNEITLVASGGISSLSDIIAVQKSGCKGVIIGKAFYENKITLKDLSFFINK
jgi:phosphoribosylformimino-5-aminoimidazole carboxamide ribotide isomerase